MMTFLDLFPPASEAQAAGRDLTKLLELVDRASEPAATCTHKHRTDAARVACEEKLQAQPKALLEKGWREYLRLCDESRKERSVARAAMAAWAKGFPARVRLVAKVQVKINGRCAWHPNGTPSRGTVHWEAMMLRRWVRILGLTEQYQSRLMKKVTNAEGQDPRTKDAGEDTAGTAAWAARLPC